MLWKLCEELDPGRLFLPSSPSGPVFGVADGRPGERHDVHGNWQYDGLRAHYEKYNCSDSMLQSEFGADGISSLRSLKSFLSDKNLKVTSMRDNLDWRHHGEWWDTLLYRDRPLFGDPPGMDGWIMASQLMQAEAIRYIVQSNRRRKFQNCGSIIWQFNEPYPNASCTSLVEYAGYPKHAYYAVRKAYAPVDVSLRYCSLLAPKGEAFKVELYVHSTQASGLAVLRFEALDIHGIHLTEEQKTVSLQANQCIFAGEQMLVLPEQPYRLFFIRLTLIMDNVPRAQQLYYFTQADEQNAPLQAMLHLPEAHMRIKRTGERFLAENIGETVCLFMHGEPEDMAPAILEDSFITLFPGESQWLIPLEDAHSWRFTALNAMECT
jgi:beta-mannosidase